MVRYDGFIRATSDTIIDEVKYVQVEDLKKDEDDIKFEYIDNIVDLRKYYFKCIWIEKQLKFIYDDIIFWYTIFENIEGDTVILIKYLLFMWLQIQELRGWGNFFYIKHFKRLIDNLASLLNRVNLKEIKNRVNLKETKNEHVFSNPLFFAIW